MTLLHEETTPEHLSNFAASVSTCNSSDTIFVSTATKEPIGAIESVESDSCYTGSPTQIKRDRQSLYIHLDDKPLPALPDIKNDNILLQNDNHADRFTAVSTETALDDQLTVALASDRESWDQTSTSRVTLLPILVSIAEPRDTPLSLNVEKTDAPSITQSTKCALTQYLPSSSSSSQPSKSDNVEVPELLPLPVTARPPPPGRTAFDSVRGIVSVRIERPSFEPYTTPLTKSHRAFDQAAIATSASITSLRAATERITEYVAVTAHTTIEYLTTSAIPSTVDFATRSANTTAQYLSNQLPFHRLFNGSMTDQEPASASLRGALHDEMEDATQRERRIRREQRRLARAYTAVHLDTLQPNDHTRGNNHTSNQRSQSAPMLVEPRNGQSTLPSGRSTRSNVQALQRPHAAFLGSRHSHTNTIVSVASSAVSSISDTTDDSTIAVSTIVSTQGILPMHKRKRVPRRPLQTIPGPEGLDPEVRRELEAQDFAALRFRDGAAQRWRNWWDPRRYGLPRYILFDEFRRPRMCTVVLLVVVVTTIALPIGLKNRD
ncbi:hypothetical protein BGZ81_007022 [Podila clonocystis]|nr:hypothetical protein BGZ81_007022 [Podila clonocystis]